MNSTAVPAAATRRRAPNSRDTSGPGSAAVASSSTSSGKRPSSPAPSRARATPTAVRSDSASCGDGCRRVDGVAEGFEGAAGVRPVVAPA